MAKTPKMLQYRRARFTEQQGDDHTLEYYLRQLHINLPNAADRIISFNGKTVEGRHFELLNPHGILIHLTVSTPGDRASLVPRALRLPQSDISTMTAPEGNEFMDGDVMALAWKNHFCWLLIGVHPERVRQALIRLFQAASLPIRSQFMELYKVPDADKMAMIRGKGIKAIEINSGLYQATMLNLQRTEETSVKNRIFSAASDAFMGLFAEDEDLDKVNQDENIVASIRFEAKGRQLGMSHTQRRLEKYAEELIDSDEDAYSIILKSGDKIGSNDVHLTKRVYLDRFGKTVFHGDAWAALSRFLHELSDRNLLGR